MVPLNGEAARPTRSDGQYRTGEDRRGSRVERMFGARDT